MLTTPSEVLHMQGEHPNVVKASEHYGTFNKVFTTMILINRYCRATRTILLEQKKRIMQYFYWMLRGLVSFLNFPNTAPLSGKCYKPTKTFLPNAGKRAVKLDASEDAPASFHYDVARLGYLSVAEQLEDATQDLVTRRVFSIDQRAP